jgi:hypothetical protein
MFSLIRVAIDSSVIAWKSLQDLPPGIQNDNRSSCDYLAIEKLFELQGQYGIILIAVDQVYRESSRTSSEENRSKLMETLKLCKDKYFLTRFKTVTSPRGAAKALGKSGINLGNGSFWITKDNERRIDKYIAEGRNEKEKRDLEVLAAVAIAGVRHFITVDYDLLENDHVSEFIQQEDCIHMYSPSEILKRLEIRIQKYQE